MILSSLGEWRLDAGGGRMGASTVWIPWNDGRVPEPWEPELCPQLT